MKNRWKILAARIDALSLRERAFLFLSLIAVCIALADLLWLSPARVDHARARQEFATANTELKRLREAVRGRIAAEITASLEASLQRLGRDSVDLFQLHNPIAPDGAPAQLSAEMVLGEVLPALERLQAEGKFRYLGITAIGDAAAMHAVVASGRIDSAQVPLNLLNPSPVRGLPAGFPASDYKQLMLRARENGVGVIGIRVLAAGALSGIDGRHPTAMQSVPPIGSSATYAADLGNARRFLPLVQEGHAGSLVEAAMRYAISNDCMSTVLVGFSDLDHLEAAIAAFEKGPLSPAAMARVAQLQARIAQG